MEVPAATPVAKPPLAIVATPVVTEVHVATLVRSCVLLSELIPVAVNCCVPPATTDGVAGVTAMEDSVGVTPTPVVFNPKIKPIQLFTPTPFVPVAVCTPVWVTFLNSSRETASCPEILVYPEPAV